MPEDGQMGSRRRDRALTWREPIAAFVASAEAAEAGMREARVRGAAPCAAVVTPPPGAVEANGHAFSWGVCVSCGGRDPNSPETAPVYELSLEDARELLQMTTHLAPDAVVCADILTEATAKWFGVTAKALKKSWRHKQYVLPRHVAMYLIYSGTHL